MTAIVFSHDCTILDACCVINIHESGSIGDILSAVAGRIAIARFVLQQEVRGVNLQPVVKSGLLTVADYTDEEAITALVFATDPRMDDGEAVTGAIAKHRNWAIATDDAKAISFFTERTAQLQLLSTPELMKHWADSAAPSPEKVRNALQNVENRGDYKPHVGHRLHGWWQANRR